MAEVRQGNLTQINWTIQPGQRLNAFVVLAILLSRSNHFSQTGGSNVFCSEFPHSVTLILICGIVFSASENSGQAITIRDDRTDLQYTTLASNFHAYGGEISGDGWYGSGVLIAPNWVLTAAHALSTSSQFITSTGIGDQIVEVVAHPELDIGLAKLATPITTITPVKLYSLDFGVEDGQDAAITGAGGGGTGITGQQAALGGMLRAAQTNVTCNASEWGWSSTELLTTFRSPNSGALNLEGGNALGDSGGGLILSVNGQDALAGVLTKVWYVGEENIGKYDVSGGVYVRSAPLNDWILSYTYADGARVVPEPSHLVLLVSGLGVWGSLLWCRGKKRAHRIAYYVLPLKFQ